MKKQKLYDKIRNNPRNVSFRDFVTLIEAFGFYYDHTSGSHQFYENRSINKTLNIQNENGKAKPYQVKDFLSKVEKYSLSLKED